ncbi:MAG: hypothetical protein GY861_12930, partial [bacterium]|nr:hypothetical protein [bacterium]
ESVDRDGEGKKGNPYRYHKKMLVSRFPYIGEKEKLEKQESLVGAGSQNWAEI